MRPTLAVFLTLALAGAAAPAAATSHDASHMNHGAMGHGDAAAVKDPAAEAYRAANAKMHGAMNAPLTGDADADFLRSMIPHHQGAIDMAKIVLEHGKDPAVKKLAAEIVAAQEREIAEMTARLTAFEKAHGAAR